MLEDRFCTQSEGQIRVTLSPQDMVNCDLENFGCSGGYFIPAIDFLQTDGATTNKCVPYLNKVDTCLFRCQDPNNSYEKYYCKRNSFKMHTSVEDIQREIYENGSVMVGLEVYEDMYSYKEGIYHYTAGGLIGGHAIRAFGWGHDE